jgi:hypothetical protein
VLLNTCCSGASEHHSTRVMHACSLQVLLTLVHSCFLLLHQPIFEEAKCCKIGRMSVAECLSYCLGSVPQVLFSDHTECMRWCGNAEDLPNDNTTCALGCQALAVNGSRWAYMQCRSACELAPYLPSEHFCAGPCNNTCNNTCNTTCAQSCAPHAVTASHANYTECMGSCSNITVAIAAISCRDVNNTKPSWCSSAGANFKAEATVVVQENASAPFCMSSPERTQCTRAYSGRVDRVLLQNSGIGYNVSSMRLALMYPPGEGHRCATTCAPHNSSNSSNSSNNFCNQSLLDQEPCEQAGTISQVFFTGNVSTGALSWDGTLGATCQGSAHCTGSGLLGTCHVEPTGICYSGDYCLSSHPGAPDVLNVSQEPGSTSTNNTITHPSYTSGRTCPGPCNYTVVNLTISDHGRGYNEQALPSLFCSFASVWHKLWLSLLPCPDANTTLNASEQLQWFMNQGYPRSLDAADHTLNYSLPAHCLPCPFPNGSKTASKTASQTASNASWSNASNATWNATWNAAPAPAIPAHCLMGGEAAHEHREAMPNAVEVSGAAGQYNARINGVYHTMAGEADGERLVYKKDGADIWIEYMSGRDTWEVKLILPGGNLTSQTGLRLTPLVPHGLRIHMKQGRGSNQPGGHSACIRAQVPQGPIEIERGPLSSLQKRLLGSAARCCASAACFRDSLTIDELALNNERLSWFLRAALGQMSVRLKNVECVCRRGMRQAAPQQEQEQPEVDAKHRHIHRTLECVGESAIFGDASLLSVAFFEVSFRSPHSVGTTSNKTQVHMALLKIHTNVSSSLPFDALRAVAPLRDLPPSSWLWQLRFPGYLSSSTDQNRPFFGVLACSAPFALFLPNSLLLRRIQLPAPFADFKVLRHRMLASPFFGGSDGHGGFLYLPGFAVSATHVGLVLQDPVAPGPDTTAFSSDTTTSSSFLGGLDRLFPKVAFLRHEVLMDVGGFLPVQGCVFPSTSDMMWVLDLQDSLCFRDAALVASSSRAVIELRGITTKPEYSAVSQPCRVILNQDGARNATIKVLLSSIREQSAAAAAAAATAAAAAAAAGDSESGSEAAEAGGESKVYEMTGTLKIDAWERFLDLRWLELEEGVMILDLELVYGNLCLKVGATSLSGTGLMTLTYDLLTSRPHPTAQPEVVVPVTFAGTTSYKFPEVMILLTSVLPPLAGPASLVRTLSQDPTHLSVKHTSCGTSAARDLSSPRHAAENAAQFSVSIATWDAAQYEILQLDPRPSNCVVARRTGVAVGTASSGEHCVFPFKYKGRLYLECTTEDWSAPWCATSANYDGRWGECECTPIRRGAAASTPVLIDTQAPMYTLHAAALYDMLSPLATGNVWSGAGGVGSTEDLPAVNGTMHVFYPVFDDAEQEALELHVNFVPMDASACAHAPEAALASASAQGAMYPTGDCERLGLVTESLAVHDLLGKGARTTDQTRATDEMCRTATAEFLSDITATSMEQFLVSAATNSIFVRSAEISHPHTSPRPRLEQQCKDRAPSLMRQMSLCAAETLHHPQHLRKSWVNDHVIRQQHLELPPPHQHRQQCFWTDTSLPAQPGAPEVYGACSVCDPSGFSCTTVNEPLAAWTVSIDTEQDVWGGSDHTALH